MIDPPDRTLYSRLNHFICPWLIRAARRHNLAHLHLLLAELHLYNSLAQAAMVALLHIDDFTEAMEDSQFHNHALIPELRRTRWLILQFRDQCRRACEVTTWRLERFFQR